MKPRLEQAIVTAASQRYQPQLLALIGSLNCNWPNHPPVVVYDIGLSAEVLCALRKAAIEVRQVPAFCQHWRKHYTWKPWCWNDAPAKSVLWLDAGCCVLRPMPEVFDTIESRGYFAIPNFYALEREASEAACDGCHVPASFRANKVAVAGGVFGFRRGTPAERVVEICLDVAMTERHIMAYTPEHRCDQALLSILLYREIDPLELCDGTMYAYGGLEAPRSEHAIWTARRNMNPQDLRYFREYLTGSGPTYHPSRSHKVALWYRVAWFLYSTLSRMSASNQSVFDGIRDR